MEYTEVNNTNTSVITPSNDGESVMIVDIARKLGFDVRVSIQKWGARLENEQEQTFSELMENVIIIEIPWPAKEAELGRKHKVFIIDHHVYGDINRSNVKSSLEQFAELVGYQLNRWEKGIALNDRGYIYALQEEGYSDKEIKETRQFDLTAQGYQKEDFERLEDDYILGYSFDDKFYIVETMNEKTSYLNDIHFFHKKELHRDIGLIIISRNPKISKWKISFSGKPAIVKALYKKFGGYYGGDEKTSMYWGNEIIGYFNKDDFLLAFKS